MDPELRRVRARLYGGSNQVHSQTRVRTTEQALEATEYAVSWLEDFGRLVDLDHAASKAIAESLRNMRAVERWLRRRRLRLLQKKGRAGK